MRPTSTSISFLPEHGFPGPKLTGVCFIGAPLLLIAGAILLFPFEAGELEDRQAALAEEQTRAAVGLEVLTAGWMLAVLVVIGLARMIASRARRVAAAGACLALAGISVSLFWSGIGTYELAMSTVPDRATVAAIAENTEPPAVILLSGAGIVLGWVVLGFGAYRAKLLGAIRALALAATALLPVTILGGFPAFMPLPFLGMALALVPLGWSLLGPRRLESPAVHPGD